MGEEVKPMIAYGNQYMGSFILVKCIQRLKSLHPDAKKEEIWPKGKTMGHKYYHTNLT